MTNARNVTPETGAATPDEERFRLYRLCACDACEGTGKEDGPMGIKQGRCEECRGEGRTRELVATATDPESVGVALVTLGREGEWDDCPIGLLDTQGETGHKWLVKPWQPSARNISDAGRTLRRFQIAAGAAGIPPSVRQGMDKAAEAEKQAIIDEREKP